MQGKWVTGNFKKQSSHNSVGSHEPHVCWIKQNVLWMKSQYQSNFYKWNSCCVQVITAVSRMVRLLSIRCMTVQLAATAPTAQNLQLNTVVLPEPMGISLTLNHQKNAPAALLENIVLPRELQLVSTWVCSRSNCWNICYSMMLHGDSFTLAQFNENFKSITFLCN